MRGFLQAYKSVLNAIGAAEKVLGVTLIAFITIAITIQVFTRYVMNQPLVWVEEAATYSFIWGAFIGASIGLKQDRHIKIATFVGFLSPRSQALMRCLGHALTLWLMFWLMQKSLIVMGVEGRSKTIALPIEISRDWFYSKALFASAASMAFTGVYLMLLDLSRAFGLVSMGAAGPAQRDQHL
ncbi:MAG: TRAP transporter small permease [Rhodospirillales bacterium]|nr:TRAP transporter small permease [Rhodospirillales bacterium]